MVKDMKRLFKNSLFTFIIGIIIACTSTAYASYVIFSNNIDYQPSDETWEVNNVGSALDSLYSVIDQYDVNSMEMKTTSGRAVSNNRGNALNISLNLTKGICYVYCQYNYEVGNTDYYYTAGFNVPSNLTILEQQGYYYKLEVPEDGRYTFTKPYLF